MGTGRGWGNYFASTLSLEELQRLRTQHNDLYKAYFGTEMSKQDLNAQLAARGAQPMSTEVWVPTVQVKVVR